MSFDNCARRDSIAASCFSSGRSCWRCPLRAAALLVALRHLRRAYLASALYGGAK